MKDSIRRRGENISASEVEALLAGLPGVAEIAAYALPSPVTGAEDELMLCIVPAAAGAPSLPELGEAVERLLPRFARPRYLKLAPELPKTATGKVQRALLRKAGPAGAFDRGQRGRGKPAWGAAAR
ncbi:hypothetical protein [Pseudoxanthomonas sp.]|uniref:AMP-binding enzyme n=1 Tax=Pseudoxanthomonas sp. TaxID=1871049 RepID=UPI0028C3C32F|nr:hypothetical protein [Pseudoxanthomonas sp.]